MTVDLRAVASGARVSVSTASRALSRPDLVNPRTADRVREVAAALGYAPNAAGVALRSGRYGGLTIMLHNLANPLFARLVTRIQHYAQERGLGVQIVDSQGTAELEQERIRSLLNRVDGIIAVAPRLSDEALASAAARLPLVVVNRHVTGVTSVTLDVPTGLSRAVDHLAALGHRHIAYVSGPTRTWSDERRRRRVHDRARFHDMRVESLGPLAPVFRSGLTVAEEVMASGVSAVIAYNSLIALGLAYRLRIDGIDLPTDLSIVAGDDMETRGMEAPTLTAVHLPIDEAASRAVDLLGEIIAGRTDIEAVQIATPLLLGDSTRAVAAQP
ncbi:LacI family DNA-binding transcriptional regulator [Ruania zhangjianzhongii]|uniref:LacI family DNA-binding transcriptional regulator n=1 Tax=Ruania zhangjianzhongii TaxID=2603206 RepID=UPI00143DD832|nr:LacI family DNA-binding transcriptional regulator [Ruania zhangjianzhongii]